MERGMMSKRNKICYYRWGYYFLVPFFLVYIVFNLIPLILTFYQSFFENYMQGLTHVGPKFVGLQNYKTMLTGDFIQYLMNTVIMWLIGFIPQIIMSLLLAVWFTDLTLGMRGKGFFKAIIYMPNLIMAAAFSMLFWTLFADAGPINKILVEVHWTKEPIRYLSTVWGNRGLVGAMNFLMWFGNTTIMLMAGIMGIDKELFESAAIDGASSFKIFTKITMPCIKPIMIYVLITSMLGGLQMFDVPQILTNGKGFPDRKSMTLIMYLNNHLFSKNYGLAGALSVILFVLTAFLSMLVFVSMNKSKGKGDKA